MPRGYIRSHNRQAGREAGTTPNRSGLFVTTTGGGGTYKTVWRFSGCQLVVPVADKFASIELMDWAAGRIHFRGGDASLQFAVLTDRATTIIDSAALDWAVGNGPADDPTLANAHVTHYAKVDKTLDGVAAAYTTASTASAAAAHTQNTGLSSYFNVGFPTGTDVLANGTLGITGTIVLVWENWGP